MHVDKCRGSNELVIHRDTEHSTFYGMDTAINVPLELNLLVLYIKHTCKTRNDVERQINIKKNCHINFINFTCNTAPNLCLLPCLYLYAWFPIAWCAVLGIAVKTVLLRKLVCYRANKLCLKGKRMWRETMEYRTLQRDALGMDISIDLWVGILDGVGPFLGSQ